MRNSTLHELNWDSAFPLFLFAVAGDDENGIFSRCSNKQTSSSLANRPEAFNISHHHR